MEELFLRHHRALGYFLRQMLDRDEIDDVQQEVWLTVIRRIGQLRDPEAFVVWLYRIARNRVLACKADSHRTYPLDDQEVARHPAVDDPPEFTAADAAQIHEELGRLSGAHREVLLLRFIENLSYEQMAAVIGCATGTVRSRLHYAKLILRQRLEKQSCPS
jgi:RNA polymerase sigma-70 factor (ECF subfamily)